MRTISGNNGLHQQYNVEEQLHNANRMAVIANMVGQGGVPPGLGSDPSAAANIAAANIANLAMRLGVTQVLFFAARKILSWAPAKKFAVFQSSMSSFSPI